MAAGPQVPGLSGSQRRRVSGGPRRSNWAPHRRAATDDELDEDEDDEDEDEDEDGDEELYEAAYDNMVYHDSTDDGIDSRLADSGSAVATTN